MYPIPSNKKVTIDLKGASLLIMIVILTNGFTYALLNWNKEITPVKKEAKKSNLYLINKASTYVHDVEKFENKVRTVSKKLAIPPEWLMSVMYSESRFDASVSNAKGSGATGLIQWMPATARDFGITVAKLRNLNHTEQLDYVYKYMNRVRKKYGSFNSLTEVYLAILYPKAIGEDYCYTLYASPSKSYTMNTILDENKDGRVTVKDIDDRMKRLFRTAYMEEKPRNVTWTWLGM